MKQHKWHKEIKAWVDGEEVEYTCWEGVNWYPVTDIIDFGYAVEKLEFRIKPQPKEPKYLYIYQDVGKLHFEMDNVIVENMLCMGKIKLEVQDD